MNPLSDMEQIKEISQYTDFFPPTKRGLVANQEEKSTLDEFRSTINFQDLSYST